MAIKKIEFEISEDLVPLQGIALIHCIGPDGEPMVAEADFGDEEMRKPDIIGLLTVSLDQYRHDFVDPGGRRGYDDEDESPRPYRRPRGSE